MESIPRLFRVSQYGILIDVTFLKISFYRKPRKIFWTVLTLHIHVHKRAKYCVTLYCPLIAGTANVTLSAFGIERTPLWELMTGTWRYALRYSCRLEDLLVLCCLKNFRSIVQTLSWVKCSMTDISLLLGKYTRTFVPRFPGIPEILYCPPPAASKNITSKGFPETSGETFWYISLKAMKYLYNITFVIDVGVPEESRWQYRFPQNVGSIPTRFWVVSVEYCLIWLVSFSVFQRRVDGSTDFYRAWDQYRDGFGL